MTFDEVDAIATSLPGMTVGSSWGNRTYLVNDKGFAWHRPLGRADLKRYGDETPPSGQILAVKVENLDAKDALLAIAPAGFFTIAHFQNYPAILIELRLARAKDVRAAILDAYRVTVANTARKKPKKVAAAKKRRPANKRKA